MSKPLTLEDRIIRQLAAGPVSIMAVGKMVELNTLRNLERKGMARFDKTTRSYVKAFEVCR